VEKTLMEHLFFPTQSVRVAGAIPGLRDGERVTIVATDDLADSPGYSVETWDGRRLRLDARHLVAIADPSQDDWDEQADEAAEDDWFQQDDQTQA